MQMLSQRIARAAGQAVQGNEQAFDYARIPHTKKFDTNLTLLIDGGGLPSSSGHAADILRTSKSLGRIVPPEQPGTDGSDHSRQQTGYRYRYQERKRDQYQ